MSLGSRDLPTFDQHVGLVEITDAAIEAQHDAGCVKTRTLFFKVEILAST